ncbi:MAG: DUF6089 family protein [Saprospiraceae bacterium]|nr:DUF6089 family protein [Saprospiraceae bacterium]
MYRRLAVVFIFLFSVTFSFAQKGWEVGGWLGTSLYYGDLNNKVNINSPGLAGGVLGKWNFNSRVALRGSLNFGHISANDADSDNNFNRNRNLSFSSNIYDLTAGFEFNFLEHIRGSKFETYSPFVFVGLSAFKYNPTAELNGQKYALQKLGTEGQDISQEYFLFSGGITLGAGFKYDISEDLTFAAEFTTRRLFTDYIDDVSTTYPDFARLQAVRGPEAVALSNRALVDGIGVPGRQRGNSSDNDRYTFLSLSITKYFGRLECPKISKI